MSRILVAAAFLAATAVAGVASNRGGVTTSASLLRTTFLSTEDAQVAITIANGTGAEIRLESGKITFDSYGYGQTTAARYCGSNCWRWFVRIAPGETKVTKVKLPACEVLEDPCTEDVTMAYPIRVGDSSHTYRVTLPQYRFVPDPNAVYRDVPDGRPVFVSTGSAKTTVIPRRIDVSVVAVPSGTFSATSTARPLFYFVRKVLAGAKITDGAPAVEPDNPLWYLPLVGGVGAMRHPNQRAPNTWRAVFIVRNGAQQIAVINDTVETVRRRFPTQVSRIDERVVADTNEFAYDAAWKAAYEDARSPAARFAQIARSGELGASGPTAATWVDYDNPMRSFYDPTTEVVFPRLPALDPIAATFNVQDTFVAARMTSFQLSPAVAAQGTAAFRSVTPPAPSMFAPNPLPAAVKMAVDRAELYVVGGASTKAALESGLTPYAVTLLDAGARTRELATLLGVRTGDQTLFEVYTREEAQNQAIGVATTFTGGFAPKAMYSVDSAVRLYPTKDLRVALRVPIEIPQPETTITEITVGTATPPPNSPGCGRIVKRLLAATLRENWLRAHRDAATARVRLRKLLLVAATPADEGPCAPQTPGTIPVPAVTVTSMMIYRTAALR